MLLGAGRSTVQSPIDHAAGIVFLRKVGDPVVAGEPIAELHYNPGHAAALPAAREMLRQALEIGPEPVPRQPLILERL